MAEQGDESGEVRRPVERFRARIRRRRSVHLAYRTLIGVVGGLIIVIGIILLPLPGPGWLVIFAGMALWATEFAWAQRILRWTKRKVTEAAHRALDPRVRRRNLALTAVGVAICAALVSVYVGKYGFVMPWGISR